MLLKRLTKVMMNPTKQNVENVLLSIIQAHRYKNILTVEEIVQRFPHAVQSFKYVDGQLKIKLHTLPKINLSN